MASLAKTKIMVQLTTFKLTFIRPHASHECPQMAKPTPPVDMDAKVRSTNIQVSDIARAIWSTLSSDKDELGVEEQICTMWNDWYLMMAKYPQSNYFGIGLHGIIRRPE
jgi:hypothetical protein